MGNSCISVSPLSESPGGLRNTEETCYINAMIQAIASSGQLYKLLKRLDKKVKHRNGKLLMLIDVIKSINEGNTNSSDNTNKLIVLMKEIGWNRSSQQDAFQLLSFLINAIEKDMKDYLKSKGEAMPPKLRIFHSFSENSKFNKVQFHLGLAIPVLDKSPMDLISSLDVFFQPSDIDDSESSTSMNLFGEPPKVLILHIQANKWMGTEGYIKPIYEINYTDELKYKFDIRTAKKPLMHNLVEVTYVLVAVVHHMGEISGGHYIAYRRHTNRWYLTNDEQIERVLFDFKTVPYIMVYEKINS